VLVWLLNMHAWQAEHSSTAGQSICQADAVQSACKCKICIDNGQMTDMNLPTRTVRIMLMAARVNYLSRILSSVWNSPRRYIEDLYNWPVAILTQKILVSCLCKPQFPNEWLHEHRLLLTLKFLFSSSPKCGKYLYKFWFKSLHPSAVHKLTCSQDFRGHAVLPWPLTLWPWKHHRCQVDMVVSKWISNTSFAEICPSILEI